MLYTYLFLLTHDLELGGHLDLALSLELLELAAPLLAMLLAQRVQRLPRVLHLRQLVLQGFKVTCIKTNCALSLIVRLTCLFPVSHTKTRKSWEPTHTVVFLLALLASTCKAHLWRPPVRRCTS